MSIPHYRWVNNNDIVARVPPPWLGYSHCGREMYFNAFGRFRKYTPWRRFRDRWYGFFLSLRGGRSTTWPITICPSTSSRCSGLSKMKRLVASSRC
ncbi:MAG: lipase family protein [Pirellulaceae bacterium]